MAKRSNPKTLVRRFANISTSIEDGARIDQQAAANKIAKLLIRPMRRAFKEAGLDISKDQDWNKLLFVLVTALYGGKRLGRPKFWSKKRLCHLVSEVEQIRETYPDKSELECCTLLVGKLFPNRNMTPTTLRRQLQEAKRQKSVQGG